MVSALLAAAGITALGISPPLQEDATPTVQGEPATLDSTTSATCRIALGAARDRGGPAREEATPESTLSAALDAVRASLALFEPDTNWDRVRTSAENRLARGDDLFDVVGATLEAIGPRARAWLRTDDGRRWASSALQDGMRERASGEAAMAGVDAGLEQVEISGDALLVSARLSDGTRYIRPRTVHAGEHESRGRHAPGPGSTAEAVASLIGALPEGAPVVIDLRFGADFGERDAVALAGCFAQESGAALHVQSVDAASGSPNEPRATMLEPGALARATGPVVLLTGPGTDNGAEVLALASMSSARVTRIGQETRGDLSPTGLVRLPNGWRMGVPSVRLLSWNLKDYDSAGIPPHIRADDAIRAALEYLSRLRASGLIPK